MDLSAIKLFDHIADMSVLTCELMDGDRVVASVTGPPEAAMREIWHYAMVYGQDMPPASISARLAEKSSEINEPHG